MRSEYGDRKDMNREQLKRLERYRRACLLRDKAKSLWYRAKGISPKSANRATLMARADVFGKQAAALWPADQPNPALEDASCPT